MTVPAPSSAPRRAHRWRIGIVSGLVAIVSSYGVATALHADAAETLLSQGKPATASSSENSGRLPGERRGRRQHRHPLVLAPSPIRSGCRSTWAPPPRSPAWR